jgi:hypothetical protein
MEFSESDIHMGLACNIFLVRGEPSFEVLNWIAEPVLQDDEDFNHFYTSSFAT